MATGKTKRNRKYRGVFEVAFAEEKELSKQVDLNAYMDFVQEVTSGESNAFGAMNKRMESLSDNDGINPSLLLTGAIGMASEGGEFAEIVKKCIFQGKPTMKLYFIVNENLAILCGIGLVLAVALVWTLTK